MRKAEKIVLLLACILGSHTLFSYRVLKIGYASSKAKTEVISLSVISKLKQNNTKPTPPKATGGPGTPEIQTFTPLGADDMVDLFTGDFKYNIPLLDVGGYPVILNYNSNPSMTEDASFVGFGWNLNVGSVDRNVRGLPDDFSGDAVIEEQAEMPELTLKGTLGAKIEAFGKSLAITPSISQSYNNYTGFYYSESLGLNYQVKFGEKKWGKFGAGIDLESSFSEGLTGSASAKFGLKDYGELKGKMKWNAEKGLKEWGIYSNLDLLTSSDPYINLDTKELEEKGPKVNASGGTTFRLKSQDFSPAVVFPRSNYAVDLDLTLGSEFLGIDASMLTSVAVSGSQLSTNSLKKAAFGYLNAHKAGESDLMDFAKSDESMIQADKPQLFPVFNTYDVYSINAEGLQTTVRPFRTDIPLLHDAKTESKGGSGGAGAEISAGNLFKGGANINGTYSEGENGPWFIKHINIPKGSLEAPDDENWYFGQVGLQTPEQHENLKQHILQGDKPVRFSIGERTFMNRLEAEVPAQISSFPTDPGTVGLRLKPESNIAIQALNADQATRFGLERSIISHALHQANCGVALQTEPLARFAFSQPNAAKAHHISEFIVTNNNGSRYHFGIPVYNKIQEEYSFNVSGDFDRIPGSRFIKYRNPDRCSENNTNGLNNRFKKLQTPAYASGYLLTAILSTDFVDVTGDGPSEDDLGTYTHFKYTRVSDKYRWRIPYGENTASLSENSSLYTTNNDGDDMASFTTGEKELWYINSIETRNYVAKFFMSPRNDGVGAGNTKHGRNARGLMVNNVCNEGQALMKLDKIVLYSKTRNETGSTEQLVKTVHFEYDYSLCKQTPDNLSNNINDNGKLTLKRVYFTHRESQKSKFSPYLFYYDNSRNYSDLHVDRWNMYKDPEGGMTNDEFPYANHGTDNYASLWRLTRILMPTGGLIKVDYERDEYAYVENKKAMDMLRVAGYGVKDGNIVSGVQALHDGLTKIYFHRPAYITQSKADTDFSDGKLLSKMFKGLKHLYYEIPIKLGNDDPNKFETITGFLELEENLVYGDDFSYSGNSKEYISLIFKADLIYEKWHPLQMDAFRFAKQSHPALMSSFGGPGQDVSIAEFVRGISGSSIVGNVMLPTLADRLFVNKNVGKKLNSDKAFCRVYHPMGRKRGGQSRVKAIRIYDNWTTMVKKNKNVSPSAISDIPEHFYGQSYDYTKETEDGIISSGVASYEPNIGHEEIPHNQPYWVDRATYYNLKHKHKNKHIASALYSAPGVGYSKVTVRSIHSGYAQSGTGRSEHEFFTAKDFPVKVEKTNCDFRKISPAEEALRGATNVIFGFLGIGFYNNHFTASQGFSIVLNDMHGKIKSVKVFEEGGDVPVAGKQYYYKTQTADNARLGDEQVFIQPDGAVQAKRINTDTDFSIYTRKAIDKAFSGTLSMNLDVFLVVPPFPNFTFTAFPGATTNLEENFLVSTTKVVYSTGIMEKIEAFNYGQTNQTQFHLADAITGSNLVSSTLNRFGKPVYSTTIPAHWQHPEMGKTAARAGKSWRRGIKFDFIRQYISNISNSFVLKPGDLIAVKVLGPASREGNPQAQHAGRTFLYNIIKVISGPNSYAVDLMDANGDKEGCYGGDDLVRFPICNAEIYLLRPAEHNQLEMEAGKIESGHNPVALNSPKLDFNKVISASATKYSDRWQTYQVPRINPPRPECTCTNNNMNQKAYENIFGRLRSTVTNMEVDNNYLSGLIRNGNCQLELWGEAVHLLFSQNASFKFISLVPDPPTYACEEVYSFTITFERTVSIPPASRDSSKIPPTVETKRVLFKGRSCIKFRTCTTAPITLASQCITPLGENVNPYRAGISGLFRPQMMLSYVAPRNYPGTFNNTDLSQAGYYANFSPYWNCPQIKQPASISPNGHWIANSRITKRDGLGKVLETRDTLGRFQASLYAFKNQFPNAIAEHARYHQIAYESFEDLVYTRNQFNNNECPKDLHFLPPNIFQASAGYTLTNEEAHTGNYALRVRPSGLGGGSSFSFSANISNQTATAIAPNCGPIGISLTQNHVVGKFQPTLGNYLVSVWIKRPGSAASSSNLADDLSGITLRLGGSLGSLNRGPIINGWQNIWDTVRIAGLNSSLRIEITGGTREFIMDDLRVHPYQANMKSFVYDPETYKLVAELDNNNFATFYDYDLEGNLERVKKETEHGVLTLKEIKFGNIKTIYEPDIPDSNNPKITTTR